MNSYWKSVKLTEIASKKRWAMNGGPFGSKLSRKHYSPDGVPVIRGCNLPAGAKFSFEDFVYVSEEKADELAANNAHPGDLVFTQRGTLGQVGLIPLDSPFPRFVISQSQMKLTVDGDLADPAYLYHVFSSPAVVQSIHNLAFSSGVPHINLDILRNFQVDLPPLPIQRRIAGILSSSDDLIENSQRRIKILEEMARRLYREWFVHFRFPGHESCRLVESPLGEIPEGWEVGRLDEVLVLQRGFDLPKSDRVDGSVPIYAATGVTGFHDTAKVGPPGVVTGRSGSIGEVLYVQEDFWPLNTALWVKDFPRSEPLYAYYLLSSLDLKQFNSGAAVPTLNRNDIHGIQVLIPSQDLQQHFQYVAGSLLSQVRAHSLQINNLHRARDLLLPRLLSGQIDVEALPGPVLSES
jgi:type I restriction enzyme S subunit